MPKPTVFVLGCSGSVGSATVRALSEKYSDKVKILAGTRDPTLERAVVLKTLPGVTVLRADMNDKEGLRELLRGLGLFASWHFLKAIMERATSALA